MDRYSRLLSLSDFSKNDLLFLHSKNVLIIGVGGVGQSVATYLITNGIKKLSIVDFDKVEISNLNRQILLTEDDIGKSKCEVVKATLLARNKDAEIEAYGIRINKENATNIIFDKYDLVIDCVDNWETKLIINDACKRNNIPLLHIGVDGYRGQVCLFKNKNLCDIVEQDVVSAPKDGVMGPMVSLISSFASLLAIEYLLDKLVDVDMLYFYDHKKRHFGEMKI